MIGSLYADQGTAAQTSTEGDAGRRRGTASKGTHTRRSDDASNQQADVEPERFGRYTAKSAGDVWPIWSEAGVAMSIVHVKRRVTQDQEEFKRCSQSDQSKVLLTPLDSSPETFSIEFSVGNVWSEQYGHTSTTMYKIPEQGITIGRHGSIVIEVGQNISVPHNMYGLVIPTGSLFLDKGIIIAAAKIEPSFTGNLKLRLFNTTATKRVLQIGDKVASGVFFSTETTQFHGQVTKRPVTIDREHSFKRRSARWSRQHWPQIVTWILAIVGCSVTSTLLTYFILQARPLASTPAPTPTPTPTSSPTSAPTPRPGTPGSQGEKQQ